MPEFKWIILKGENEKKSVNHTYKKNLEASTFCQNIFQRYSKASCCQILHKQTNWIINILWSMEGSSFTFTMWRVVPRRVPALDNSVITHTHTHTHTERESQLYHPRMVCGYMYVYMHRGWMWAFIHTCIHTQAQRLIIRLCYILSIMFDSTKDSQMSESSKSYTPSTAPMLDLLMRTTYSKTVLECNIKLAPTSKSGS